eukprot:SM000050S17039  [mRNA]  locus=s50:497195:498048:- [translate_table: standard]
MTVERDMEEYIQSLHPPARARPRWLGSRTARTADCCHQDDAWTPVATQGCARRAATSGASVCDREEGLRRLVKSELQPAGKPPRLRQELEAAFVQQRFDDCKRDLK